MPAISTTDREPDTDAIHLLKQVNRQLQGRFDQYPSARNLAQKQSVAAEICLAVQFQSTLEQELLYPALLAATEDSMPPEAELEHLHIQALLEQVQDSSPIDEFFDSRMRLLEDLIEEHIFESERSNGLFAQAQASAVDMRDLGLALESKLRAWNDR